MRANAAKIVLLLIGCAALKSPGKSHSLFPVNSRNISNTSNACLANGTMCGVRIFMRSGGMSQRAFSRSNSVHLAPINSQVRTKVTAINFIASRVTCFP